MQDHPHISRSESGVHPRVLSASTQSEEEKGFWGQKEAEKLLRNWQALDSQRRREEAGSWAKAGWMEGQLGPGFCGEAVGPSRAEVAPSPSASRAGARPGVGWPQAEVSP